jgi:acyl-coenzyme A thioesterase 9
MRAHRIPWLSPTGASDNPWLSSSSPDLASDGHTRSKDSELSEEEIAELARPRHMSESYTSFDLPLASDATLYDRYVNTSGGFRMCNHAAKG